MLSKLSDIVFKAWYTKNHKINFIQCYSPEGNRVGRVGKTGKKERNRSLRHNCLNQLNIKLLFPSAFTCFLVDLRIFKVDKPNKYALFCPHKPYIYTHT